MTGRCVTLIQQGARRNYVYAQLLERHGLLERLVTDAAYVEDATTPLARLLAAAGATRRKIAGVPGARHVASVLPNLVAKLRRLAHEERVFPLAEEALALSLRLRGVRPSRVVVNYLGNGGSFLERARAGGSRIVTDFIITPDYLEVEARERETWPGWETESASPALRAAYRARIARLVAVSDFYLCPSETVARDLSRLPGFDPAKVRLTPYGVSGVSLAAGEVAPGRILFSGVAGLRKGLPYLAEAARRLKDTDPQIEVVVAGAASDAVRARPETAALTFLGHLDRDTMAREFARADVFCLPSLAEGSATSVYEALANGLPVVTTPSSGSVIEHGVEGFIVPERDGAALAEAIGNVVRDRTLRATMAQNALAAAERYSDSACGEAFVVVIREAIRDADAPR